MADECIFCGIVSGEIPAKIVYRDDEVVAFEDIKPVAPVHILVIPIRHIDSIRDVSREDDGIIGKLIATANQLARDKGGPRDRLSAQHERRPQRRPDRLPPSPPSAGRPFHDLAPG